MKFGIAVFPGSNCDQDAADALKRLTGKFPEFLWHKEADLKGCDFIVLPGGFSYGDYLRSGAIARFSPVMGEVMKHAKRGGYVLGICNGFQILTESGLLPGALLPNTDLRFVCKDVYIKPATTDSLLTSELDPDKGYRIPIAHGEGRYFAKADTLRRLHDEDRILFQYCDEEGVCRSEANPNGSLEAIAGVMNEGRNVFGMMPHPERAFDEELGNTDGAGIFQSILKGLQVVVSGK